MEKLYYIYNRSVYAVYITLGIVDKALPAVCFRLLHDFMGLESKFKPNLK